MSRRSERKRHRELQQAKAENPEKCFCDREPGIAVVRSHSDELLGYTDPMHSVYDYDHTGPTVRYPIRRCSVCGKWYIDAPMTA